MQNSNRKDDFNFGSAPPHSSFSQSIDWYTEGESRTIEVNGVRVAVRFIGRKSRRARIAITGPAGAVFRAGT